MVLRLVSPSAWDCPCLMDGEPEVWNPHDVPGGPIAITWPRQVSSTECCAPSPRSYAEGLAPVERYLEVGPSLPTTGGHHDRVAVCKSGQQSSPGPDHTVPRPWTRSLRSPGQLVPVISSYGRFQALYPGSEEGPGPMHTTRPTRSLQGEHREGGTGANIRCPCLKCHQRTWPHKVWGKWKPPVVLSHGTIKNITMEVSIVKTYKVSL